MLLESGEVILYPRQSHSQLYRPHKK